jgi:hypothetical protein
MSDKPLNIRFPPELRDRIDAVRPAVPSREAWVRAQVERVVAALEAGSAVSQAPGVTAQGDGLPDQSAPVISPAPPRAPRPKAKIETEEGTPLPKFAKKHWS